RPARRDAAAAGDAGASPPLRPSPDCPDQRGEGAAARGGAGTAEPQPRQRGGLGQSPRGSGGAPRGAGVRRAAPGTLARRARADHDARGRAGSAAAGVVCRRAPRLQTIPGVGSIVASTAIAVFSDIGRFPDAQHAASYAGLVPATYPSGARDAHGRITKRGAAELRATLCEAAHHASRPDHPLPPYFAPLAARRGYKMAVVAVAHRLCRIIFAML